MTLQLREQTLGDFLDAAAAKSPTPGGGAVASVTAALAAALGQMVLQYSKGKKSLAEHATMHASALEQLQHAATRALELAAADAEAYGKLNALWKLEKADPLRREQWPAAVAAAIAPPREIVDVCHEMLELMQSLVGKTNAMLDSDLAIAAVLADAGARAGAWNVRVNLPLLDEEQEADDIEQRIDAQLAQCRAMCDAIEQACYVTCARS